MASLWTELRRRNVFRVAVLYAIVAWILLQVSDIILPLLELPEWTGRFVLFVLGLGFPIAVFFAWAFEITPDGIKKEKDVNRSQSITQYTGRKIDFVIIGVLVIALGYFAINHDWGAGDTEILADAASVTVSRADGKKSIAVLPFSNLSDDESNEFFTSGVHEDILTYLTRVNDLHVISRTSVLRYEGTQMDLRDIANELNVDHIVEGSVRRSGDRVRITAQLIDANSDGHLWADNYDRRLDDVFAIQTEVARAIVASLEAELSPNEQRLLAAKPTENVEAYDYFLQARDRVRESDYSVDKYRDAERLFRKAVELDPGFALAWLGIAEAHGQYFWQGADLDGSAEPKARDAIERAKKISPDLPEGHIAMGEYYYRFHSDFQRSIDEFERALDAMPANGDLWARLALSQRRNGQFDESIESFEKSQELDPGHAENDSAFMETLDLAGQWERLIERADRRLEDEPKNGVFGALKATALINGRGDVNGALKVIAEVEPVADSYYHVGAQLVAYFSRQAKNMDALYDEPVIAKYVKNDPTWAGWASFYRGEAHVLVGDRERGLEHVKTAAEQFEKSLQGFNDYYFTRQGLATAQAFLGECDDAMKNIDRARAQMPETKDKIFGVTIRRSYARVLMLCGETEAALDELEHQVEVPAGVPLWNLKLSPEWDPLREHPRFQAMIAETES